MSTPYSSYSILNSANNNNNNSTATSSTAYPATPSQTPAAATSTQYTAVFDSNSLQNLPGTPTPAGRGRPRGGGGVLLNGHGQGQGTAGTGAKRGRKPRGGVPESSTSFMTSTFSASGSPPHSSTPLSFATTTTSAATASSANAQYPRVHWAMPGSSTTTTAASGSPVGAGESANSLDSTNNNNNGEGSSSSAAVGRAGTPSGSEHRPGTPLSYSPPSVVIDPALTGPGGIVTSSSGAVASTTLAYTPTVNGGSGSRRGTPLPEGTGSLILPGSRGASVQPYGVVGAPGVGVGARGGEDEAEGDDELLPAMADDDYSAQLSWQSQSKDNLKVLMDNLSPAQYDRFEAYRRHALPKQAVRKVIQQTLGQQVSQPVAQIIAGFSKVFIGEIVEKARAVQTRRGETGPLSPDHLREAYRAYQEETGRVGSARPLRAKKLFVR